MERNNPFWTIDIAKLFFCICVVITHTKLLSYLPQTPRTIINGTIIRLSVPFFFTASGFFLGQNIEKRGYAAAVKRYCLRMLKPLIIFESIGVLINILYMLQNENSIPEILLRNIQGILFYPRVSMWFLQACIIGACLVYTLRKTGIRIQLLIGIVLFAFALICNNYYSVSQAIGISDFIDWYLELFISSRNGLFYGYSFLTIGQFLFLYKKNFDSWSGHILAGMLIVIFLIYAAESLYIDGLVRADDGSLFISQLLAAPLVFITLVKLAKKYPDSRSGALQCRKYSTGIYYVQKIVLYCVESAFFVLHFTLTPVMAFCLVLLISIGICFVSHRNPVIYDIMQ